MPAPGLEVEGKFREWLQAIDQHGPLMTRDMAAAALAVSRQRVHQLITKGQLVTVRVGDHRYVPLAALQTFARTEDRVVDRRLPRALSLGVGPALLRSNTVGQAATSGREQFALGTAALPQALDRVPCETKRLSVNQLNNHSLLKEENRHAIRKGTENASGERRDHAG